MIMKMNHYNRKKKNKTTVDNPKLQPSILARIRIPPRRTTHIRLNTTHS